MSAPSNQVTRQNWLPIAVGLLGLASLAVLVTSDHVRQRLVDEELRLALVVDELQIEAATIHLWLEEYLAGDDAELDRIRRGRERVDELRLFLNTEFTAPLARAGVDLAATQRSIDRFLERSVSRIERYDQLGRGARTESVSGVGVGSPTDVEYDEIYEILMSELTLTRVAVDRSLDRAEARATLTARALLASWAFVTALATGGLWWYERRRRSAEAALAQSQEQLFQAQKMEAVGRLAGGIAHDINNYLGAITAHCELVRLQPREPERTVEKMHIVESTVKKASALIQQLLAFSRKQPIRRTVVNLNDIANDIAPMTRRLIGDAIAIEARLDSTLWNTLVDRSQAEQILVNLVINARDAMPNGGRLTVETRNLTGGLPDTGLAIPVPGDRDYVMLRIDDEGAGIPVALRERVFEPFFSTKTEGISGLGLATVYAILQQNSGSVRIGDAPGGGARVEIYLPRSHDRLPETAAEVPHELTVRRPLRILLVEDNESLRDAMQEALTGLGHQVLAAANGRLALEALAEVGTAPELLVTDVVMPEMGGKALADQLLSEYSDLKVLFVSGYSDDGVLHQGVAQGSIDLLQKPYTLVDLVRKIEEVSA